LLVLPYSQQVDVEELAMFLAKHASPRVLLRIITFQTESI